MSRFYKVSYHQYLQDTGKEDCVDTLREYGAIKLPERATRLSAGYDFFAPFAFTLQPGESIRFSTGVGIELDSDKFLACYPRSGLGFKNKAHLWNTVGIIDADYSLSDNEGHIGVKLCNGGNVPVTIEQGTAYMQGIITQYFLADGDNACGVRNGGFGSTDE